MHLMLNKLKTLVDKITSYNRSVAAHFPYLFQDNRLHSVFKLQ